MRSLVAFFEIPATDMGRAVRFYESVLNIRLDLRDGEREKMAFFPEENGLCPGAVSWSSEFDFQPSGQGVLVSLNVEDMDQAIRSVEECGGKIVIPKTRIEARDRGFFAVFIDSEGNRVGLYSDN